MTLPGLRRRSAPAALLVALYTLSDFGVVSLMRYDALTRAIFLQYRALFDRTPAAMLSLVLVALTAVVLALEARTRRGGRLHRVGPARPAPQRIALGAGAACARVLHGSSSDYSCAPRGGARLLVARRLARRSICRGTPVSSLARASGLAPASPPRGAAGGGARAAYPATVDEGARAAGLRGERASGHRDRALARVLRRPLRAAVYQTLALLVFAYVVRFFPQALAGSSRRSPRHPRVEEAARGLGRGPWRRSAR